MRRITLICVMISGLCCMGFRVSAPFIIGSWNGDDWGTVTIKGDLTGTYSSTYNGKPGRVVLKKGEEGKYNGRWSESDERRYGTLTVRVGKDGKTAAVTWKALDDTARPRGGESLWRRKP